MFGLSASTNPENFVKIGPELYEITWLDSMSNGLNSLHLLLQFAVFLLGSWDDLTSQFLQDCDHSQALFDSSDQSVTDLWNHGFTLLAVLYASFNCDNRFISIDI